MKKFNPLLLLMQAAATISLGLPPDETFYETPEVIAYSGYPVETHNIVTEDGYFITLFRIPHGRRTRPGGPPVLLYHAYGLSSRDWFTMDDPEDNLPFQLANTGHDIWLVNSRGTRYSNTHVTFNKEESEYWNFSFHEIGKYEVPAVVKYILQRTRKSQLSYICHSMGCTSFIVCIDQFPELNAVFKKAVFLAPATYMEHVRNPVKFIRLLMPPNLLLLLKQKVAAGRVFKPNLITFLRNKGPFICTFKPGVTWKACITLYFIAVGFNYDAYDERKTSLIVGNALEEASIKCGTHYLQWVRKPFMRQYDYGKKKNLMIYGSTEPPIYDVEKIKVTVMVMYAANDKLTVVEDTLKTILGMENSHSALIRDPKFNHFDFIYANTAPDVVFPRVVEFLR